MPRFTPKPQPARAGELRRPVFLEPPNIVRDNAGGETITWPDSFKTWALIEGVTGREASDATTVKDSIDCRIVLRYDSAHVPNARWRVRDAETNQLFNILSALVDYKHGTVECLAATVVNAADGR